MKHESQAGPTAAASTANTGSLARHHYSPGVWPTLQNHKASWGLVFFAAAHCEQCKRISLSAHLCQKIRGYNDSALCESRKKLEDTKVQTNKET